MNVNLDPIYSMSGASLGKKKDASQWGNVEGSQLVFSLKTLRKHFQVLSSPVAGILRVGGVFFSQGACDLLEAGLA